MNEVGFPYNNPFMKEPSQPGELSHLKDHLLIHSGASMTELPPPRPHLLKLPCTTTPRTKLPKHKLLGDKPHPNHSSVLLQVALNPAVCMTEGKWRCLGPMQKQAFFAWDWLLVCVSFSVCLYFFMISRWLQNLSSDLSWLSLEPQGPTALCIPSVSRLSVVGDSNSGPHASKRSTWLILPTSETESCCHSQTILKIENKLS